MRPKRRAKKLVRPRDIRVTGTKLITARQGAELIRLVRQMSRLVEQLAAASMPMGQGR